MFWGRDLSLAAGISSTIVYSYRKAAEAFRFLRPTEVSHLLRYLLDALTNQNKRQQGRNGDCSANQIQRPALRAPSWVEGLDKEEALYLRRGAKRVMTLWNKAWSEGWAEVSHQLGNMLALYECV